jgi:hypothetical protein
MCLFFSFNCGGAFVFPSKNYAGARELMQGLWNVSKIFPTINFTLDREKVEKEMGAILRVDWTAVESTEKNLFDPRENGYQYVLSSENF